MTPASPAVVVARRASRTHRLASAALGHDRDDEMRSRRSEKKWLVVGDTIGRVKEVSRGVVALACIAPRAAS